MENLPVNLQNLSVSVPANPEIFNLPNITVKPDLVLPFIQTSPSVNLQVSGDLVHKPSSYNLSESLFKEIKIPEIAPELRLNIPVPKDTPLTIGADTQLSYPVTRANGTKIDIFKDIPTSTLESPSADYLKLPDATTVDKGFGVVVKQAKASPVEAKRIILADTVEETLKINNENGIPLKFEANPSEGEKPYFYKDAPYGGRQKVNTTSLEVTYTHEATADWGLTPEYVAEYADANGMCPDRAVVAAGDDPNTGLKGKIADKQYEIINPDGTRKPLVTEDLKAGETVQIIKKEGVELKVAIFDEPTTSLEGETLPAGKLLMIDSEGHPYNGNPVKRLRSGEVEMSFDENNPQQLKMKQTLDEVKSLDVQTKSAKKAGNKELAAELKTKADGLAKDFEAQLTDFVKVNQNKSAEKD